MKQRPILFNTEMVQAILAGRKMQTRREVHPDIAVSISNNPDRILYRCPFGQTGDVLWVRESCLWVMSDHAPDLLEGSRDRTQWVYKASEHEDFMKYAKEQYGYKWKPSIHMPKDAARIWLRIKDVRVERLQEISEIDAMREGIESVDHGAHWKNYVQDDISSFVCPSHSFESLWHSINGADSWNANPWVWVLEFERIEKPN